MLRAKPMNDSLSDVRGRQMKKLAEVKLTYCQNTSKLEYLNTCLCKQIIVDGYMMNQLCAGEDDLLGAGEGVGRDLSEEAGQD